MANRGGLELSELSSRCWQNAQKWRLPGAFILHLIGAAHALLLRRLPLFGHCAYPSFPHRAIMAHHNQGVLLMTIFPSLRRRSIGIALFRRAREAAAMGAVLLAAACALLSPLLLASLMGAEATLSFQGLPQEVIVPPHLYPPLMAAGAASAFAWILRSRAAPPALVASAPDTPFSERATRACRRSFEISNSAIMQFFGSAPLSVHDPRALSLPTRYRSLRSAGHCSTVAASAACLAALPAAAIGFGLILLALAASVGFVVFFIYGRLRSTGLGLIAAGSASLLIVAPAAFIGLPVVALAASLFYFVYFIYATLPNLLPPAPASPLLAARQWAAQLSERLEAEGSADLAASEASLLDRELPASAKPAKSPRL